MIYITRTISLGSKKFTFDLADAIRDDLKAYFDADTFEDFELDLYQATVRFNRLSAEDFNKVYNIVQRKTSLDKLWYDVLLEHMQQDERFNPQDHLGEIS